MQLNPPSRATRPRASRPPYVGRRSRRMRRRADVRTRAVVVAWSAMTGEPRPCGAPMRPAPGSLTSSPPGWPPCSCCWPVATWPRAATSDLSTCWATCSSPPPARRWCCAGAGRSAPCIVTAALATYLLRHYVGGPIYVTAWIGLFFLSWRSSRRTALIGRRRPVRRAHVAGLVAARHAGSCSIVFIGWSAAAVFLGEVAAEPAQRPRRAPGAGPLPRADARGGGPAAGRRGPPADRP